MISVVIPVYNEEECLLRNTAYYQSLSQSGELIFVDGGSTDRTVILAGNLGRVIAASKNRAAQMNQGVREAKNKILLFLHADAVIHPENLRHIIEAIEKQRVVGGCFQQVLDDPALLYRWIAWSGNIRAKLLKVFYGDQAIFVRKDIFEGLGGFPEVKIGEDVLFTKKLRTKGRVNVLPYHVQCSARRWKKQGIARTFLLNLRINLALICNQNLDQLANLYQDARESPEKNN
jgi:rSAM/selenodomain-associated transferase 2